MSQHLIVVLMVAVATLNLVAARPADGDAQAQIVKFDNDVRIDGYDFAYETSNGIKRTESGVVKAGSKPDEAAINVNGDFSYALLDGTPFSVTFVASEDGYRPVVTIGQARSG
ncbi:unnamed protein product [Callosobruchus maculatus]|uniref:Uncharacterized protein n=1 Tax=Callosobruchus maculatus TaxID=64391 RepID=A0A653BQD2_CALMS|nr:unnamed protein product [Callosobruchus maculatus]